ncbi:hypothetical protein [Desulfovibrio litoralis]|uniref:Uncharacterized protein n=1 Tax=Desulfovibrio litoralis DSM 11393 TaxID=1121455 RepID=A0A1M7THF0_9BACT|nr:hypothetical protein [Desulfovibrio litoralis]SHN70184.1 hypothetical protein SAMN02745728_02009 [Desulfovibrio litoralis DSM 11393]
MWSGIKKVLLFLAALALAVLIVGLPLYWFLWKDNPSLNPFVVGKLSKQEERPVKLGSSQEPVSPVTVTRTPVPPNTSDNFNQMEQNKPFVNTQTPVLPTITNQTTAVNATENSQNTQVDNSNIPVANSDSNILNVAENPVNFQANNTTLSPILGEASLNQTAKKDNGILSNVATLKLDQNSMQAEEQEKSANQTSIKDTKRPFQDHIVRFDFVEDLAKTLVRNYRPRTNGKSGTVIIDVRYLNTRYAGGQHGLIWHGDSGNLKAMRTNIFNYVLSPSMLTALTDLYLEKFIGLINAEAPATSNSKGEGLSPSELSELYTLYANQFRMTASVLNAFATNPSLAEQQEELLKAQGKVASLQAQYITLSQELSTKKPQASQHNELDQLNRSYQQAVAEQRRIKQELLKTVKTVVNGAKNFNDDNILYIISWAARRNNQESIRQNNGLSVASGILNRVAKRFEQEAKQ